MYGMADSDLGIRIRRARERKRWSQEQLAAALGVGKRSVGRWERGEAEPRNAIGALEEVLGVKLTGAEDALDFDPDDAYEVRVMSWTDLSYARRLEMIAEWRAANAARDGAPHQARSKIA